MARILKKKFLASKWKYPLVYILFIFISLLPPITEVSFPPEDTQKVIIELLKVSIIPYRHLGIIFHILFLIQILLIIMHTKNAGRVIAGSMGLDYIIISVIQSIGNTETFGIVIHTGGLVAFFILGLTWLWVAFKEEISISSIKLNWQHVFLMVFTLLAFWSPYKEVTGKIVPDFDPLLLINSADFGLTFCFTTPVFLFFLILIYPNVNKYAFRITAFNALIYAIYNLSHWINPETRWMGVLHLPLLVLSIYSLSQSTKAKLLKMDNP